MNDSPAFQFYPHDWLSDWAVELMTNEQLGAYLRLVCHAWHSDQPGRLPNDRSTLAGLSRTSVEWWDVNGPAILRAFRVDDDGYITQKRMAKEWDKQQTRRHQQVEAGKASAEKRQRAFNERSTSVQHTGNSSSSSSSSVQTPISPKGELDLAVESEPSVNGWHPDPLQLRINAIFDRRETTRWSDKELRAWKRIQPVARDDLELIERYYREKMEPDYRRKDICTLLNNWTGELDRARNFKPKTAHKFGV